MPINPHDFMIYYAVFVIAGVLLLVWRRPRRGVRLKLGGKAGQAKSPMRAPTTSPQPTPPRERPLNVIFNYNGHSWDAYEVLGLPAGSNLETVQVAFKESRERVDPTSRPFVEAAYRAIVAQWTQFRAG